MSFDELFIWDGKVGKHEGEPTKEEVQECLLAPAYQGLVMCLMAYAKRTLLCILNLYFLS
jgi:hypothetical protein